MGGRSGVHVPSLRPTVSALTGWCGALCRFEILNTCWSCGVRPLHVTTLASEGGNLLRGEWTPLPFSTTWRQAYALIDFFSSLPFLWCSRSSRPQPDPPTGQTFPKHHILFFKNYRHFFSSTDTSIIHQLLHTSIIHQLLLENHTSIFCFEYLRETDGRVANHFGLSGGKPQRHISTPKTKPWREFLLKLMTHVNTTHQR